MGVAHPGFILRLSFKAEQLGFNGAAALLRFRLGGFLVHSLGHRHLVSPVQEGQDDGDAVGLDDAGFGFGAGVAFRKADRSQGENHGQRQQ